MRDAAKRSATGSSTRQAKGLGRIVRGAFATRAASRRADGSGAPSGGSEAGSTRPRVLLALLGATLLATLVLGVAFAGATAPTATINAPANVRYTTAHVSGTLDPGDQFTWWSFETSTDGSNWSGFAYQGNVDGSSDPGSHNVEADLSGLKPGTHYFVRLTANNFNDPEAFSSEEEFETEAVAKPTVTIEEVTTFDATTATFVGHVTPNSPEPEGSTDAAEGAAFETSWHFQCTPDCGNLSGEAVKADDSAHEVSAEATGLEPNTAYHVKLVASNLGGTEEAATAASPSFTTIAVAPLVKAFAAGPVSFDQADINGEVDPRNSPTVYWFEWGTEDCSAPGASCESVPLTQDAAAGSDHEFHYFTHHLTGLSPQTTYHFRILAENAVDTTEGPDEQFTTAAVPPAECPNEALRVEQHSTFLPDCRAYEMVSPPDKNGGDVRAASERTYVADDGGAVIFPSYTGFADPEGTQLDTEYLAERTGAAGTPGWATRSITPKQGSLSYAAVNNSAVGSFLPAFTPDLSSGVYRSWRPLTDAPKVDEVSNLYRIDGLRGGGGGTTLLSDAFEPITPPGGQLFFMFIFQPFLVGASTDLDHVVFESRWQLTPEAPLFSIKLYEYAEGGVRLVGVLPDGSPAPEAQATVGGESAQQFYPIPHAVSADGSHIFFTDTTTGDFATSGNVYVRIDGEETIQLNASERGTPEEHQAASLWAASADGSRAFFVTGEGLVDGDTNGLPDLYMWHEQPDAEGHHLTVLSVDSEPSGSNSFVKAVVGTSDDGHYVYFISDGALVPGAPRGVSNGLYLWHDGAISFIGSLRDAFENQVNTPAALYNFTIQNQRSRVTPDGRHLLFTTTTDGGTRGFGGFPGYDHGTCPRSAGIGCYELYSYSADTGQLRCASCNPSGAPATADAVPFVNKGYGPLTPHLPHALSDDGRWVFFNTAEGLVPEDTNGRYDAYEYDTQTEQVHLLSSGTEEEDSYFLDASPSGDDVFIATHERLAGWDTDTNFDVYDVRVHGGFPEPPPVPAACAGESCRGAASTPPPGSALGSASLVGPGNRHGGRPHGCPRGKVKRHGKCVARKSHKSRHHKRSRSRTSLNSGGQK